MLNMDKKLLKRQEEGKIIKTGIVGAGQMGRGMVTQMVLMNGIMPAIVSDIKIENAVHAFKYAGVTDDDIVIGKSGRMRHRRYRSSGCRSQSSDRRHEE